MGALMDLSAATATLFEWVSARVDVQASAVVRVVAELLVVTLAIVSAWLIRRATVASTDAWLARLERRFRPARVMASLRPLVAPAICWGLIVIASRSAWVFGETAPLLGVAANLVALWIVIRATSALVRDPLLSRLIASAAWIVAALNILGL